MNEDTPLSPWTRVFRHDLKSGFAYPVNKREVAAALRRARVEGIQLSF